MHFEYMLDHILDSANVPVAPPEVVPKKPQPPKPVKPAPPAPPGKSSAPIPASSISSLMSSMEFSKDWLEQEWQQYQNKKREEEVEEAHDAIQSDSGYFPIGLNLTWHGGIHCRASSDGSVHAMTDGIVVAARLPEKDPAKLSYGSRNFVLVKHKTPLGKPFWTLYMHLRPILLKPDDPNLSSVFPWLLKRSLTRVGEGISNLRKAPDAEHGEVVRELEPGETFDVLDDQTVGSQKWFFVQAKKDEVTGWVAQTSKFELKSEIPGLQDIKAGKVVKLSAPVKRGDCLGFISPAPAGKNPFLHWEVFSDAVVSDQWIQVKDDDALKNDIVCDAVEFKQIMNKSRAVTFFHPLNKDNIREAYNDPKTAAQIRSRTFFFKSEWAVVWDAALDRLKSDYDVKDLAPRLQLYNFWKDAESLGCDLPKGGSVWHYHPTEFIAREYPVPKAADASQGGENGIFTIIDKKAWVREDSLPHGKTTEVIPFFSKVTQIERSGEFAKVQVNEGEANKWTSIANYVSFIKDDLKFNDTLLVPQELLQVKQDWTRGEKSIAGIYNRLGGLMKALGENINIEVEAALAVWFVESGGHPHIEGRAIIRFENHCFWDNWGNKNAEVYDKAFQFQKAGKKRYLGHKASFDGGKTWESCHNSGQDGEYRVLNLARTFDQEAACNSISIGGCQIMVSNHLICGYKTATEMYNAFQVSEKSHVLGFFDFCQFKFGWHSRNEEMFKRIRAHDWTEFANAYNGPGKPEEYGTHIDAAYKDAKNVLS